MIRFIKSFLRICFTWYSKKQVGSYNLPFRVSFYSRFTKHTYLGTNTNFNGICIRGKGKVVIGDNFHSGKNVLIVNTYHKYDFGDSIPYDSKKSISKDVIIGDNVWIGDRVLILGGVTIGEGAIIQAGAVVVKDIPKYAIAGGNPATEFKQRDVKSYMSLKDKGKYW